MSVLSLSFLPCTLFPTPPPTSILPSCHFCLPCLYKTAARGSLTCLCQQPQFEERSFLFVYHDGSSLSSGMADVSLLFAGSRVCK